MGDSLGHIQTTSFDNGLFAVRPDYGGQGNQNLLWVNYFKMILDDKNLVLHRYDMEFEVFPSKEPTSSDKEMKVPEGKKLVQVIRCALATSTFNEIKTQIATDFAKTLVSCKRLENNQLQTGQFKFWAENEIENQVPRPRKKATRYRMTLKHSGDLHISDLVKYMASKSSQIGAYEDALPVVQALDIVLGHYGKLSLDIATPKYGKCFPLGPPYSRMFNLRGPGSSAGYLQGVRGFFASVRATTDRALVNCNACCGAFYKPGDLVTLFAMFISGQQQPSLEQYKRLEKAIQGLRVELTHLKDENGEPTPTLRTIYGLAHPYGGPEQVQFYHKGDNEQYTIAAYWRKQGYQPIRNLAYPVVNVGNKDHPTLIPPHVCKIFPGQMAKKKLDSTQTTDMIESARINPKDTIDSINGNAFGVLGLKDNPTLDSFGISLDSDMVRVYGRVLPQPKVEYRANATIPSLNDVGRWSVTSKMVYKAEQLKNWGVLRIFQDGQDDKEKFTKTCSNFLGILKKTLGPSKVDDTSNIWSHRIPRGGEAALSGVFDECKRDYGMEFLVIVLPDKDASLYKEIKRLGDVEYGIKTVCVLGLLVRNQKSAKFYRPDSGSYFANVALKINLQLGGINHILRDQKGLYANTMVIGIDVTHPSPGPTKRTAPSVAAMVASVDSQLAQWPVDLRINTAGKEMVELLGPMLKSRLDLWKRYHGGALPDNLLIYRDGVSESQYKAVLDVELDELQKTSSFWYKREGRVPPKVTLIIVGKRHHTRFFKQDGYGGCTNPVFGTVVDTGVTEARNWDFFLQSHHALLGTARPAHYFVLRNEIFTREFVGPNVKISDYLHELTYHMCYLFGRSTGPVSIPPPVYYADLACERSRCYGDFDDDISDTSSMVADDRGNPQDKRGEQQLAYRGQRSGSQASNAPGPSKQGKPGSSKNPPSKQGSGFTAPGKKVDMSKKQVPPTESKTLDSVAGLSKKDKERLWEERTRATSQKAAQGGSSKAEEKKLDLKSEANPEAKSENKKPEEKSKGKSEKETAPSKAEAKKPEKSTESKKPETKLEAPRPETQAEPKETKEKAKVEVHKNLKDTMFYV